jgi:imidazolonepropionase-like amidohydrolase
MNDDLLSLNGSTRPIGTVLIFTVPDFDRISNEKFAMRPALIRYRGKWFAMIAAAIAVATAPLFSADAPVGYHPTAYALRGGKVFVGDGTTYDPGTVVVRDGVIQAVGSVDKITIPLDAEIVDATGLSVYPGLIDAYTSVGVPLGVKRSKSGGERAIAYNEYALAHTPEDNRNGMTPEFEVAEVLEIADSAAAERRALGFTDILSAPAGAIATGQSAVSSLSDLPRRESLVKAPIALHINLSRPFEPQPPAPAQAPAVPFAGRGRGRGGAGNRGNSGGYPSALMGVIAHLRQTMLDAARNQELRAYAVENPSVRPVFDPALAALELVQARKIPVWWEANTRDEIHRVLDLSDEFGVDPVIVGGREAGKVVDRLKARNVAVVLRINFAEEPKTPSEDEYAKKKADQKDVPLRVLVDRHERWKEQVATAKALEAAGIKYALSTDGLGQLNTFPAQVRKLIAEGLKADSALAALTKRAAEITRVSQSLGTIERGKLGHIVALTAPFGDEKAKVRYLFVDGRKFDLDKPQPGESTKAGPKGKRARGGKGETPSDSAAKTEKAAAKSSDPSSGESKSKKEQVDPKTDLVKSKGDSKTGESSKNAQALKPEGSSKTEANPRSEAKSASAKADTVAAKTDSESPKPVEASKPAASTTVAASKAESNPAKSEAKASKDQPAKEPVKTAQEASKEKEKIEPKTPFVDTPSELDVDRKPAIHTGGNVMIKDATILTVSHGTLPKGSILIRNGEIAAIGADIETPEGFVVIDGRGLVAMPGIIDTHSHMAIQGGVNEMSLSIVPEVRIKDVVDGADPEIYRAIAGGVTAARLLHGSANTIGGQDGVIKLRPGMAARDLIVKDGLQGVKFALGENVTRVSGRFPNTRLGVEAVIERAFQEAEAYKKARLKYDTARAQGESPPPIRRDLRLEALVGILDGNIHIHSHCYRSDEILMLLRTAARHGVKVRSLQHVLEGYKIASEIAEHGASASTFADWWAYKVEAYDAIPFNSALMSEAGVKVCIKSDDDELVRHLNLDAAKLMKYGGMSETQALETITINPARQLGLDRRMGSIDVGKAADIALYNGHPLDAFSRCELVLVDGEVRFQRKEPGNKMNTRSGDHSSVPLASVEARSKTIEIARDPGAFYAITGARVHPVSSAPIDNGVLVIERGKIKAVGGPETPIPPGVKSIDARGLDVWPGMIDSGTYIGLTEIGSLNETNDYSDSATIEPELTASSALHPDSELIPVTRANGILSAYVHPSGGIINGQGCVIDLNGWTPNEMVLADRAALDIKTPSRGMGDVFGFNRPDLEEGGGGGGNDRARTEQIDRIKQAFKDALAYDKLVSESIAKNAPAPAPDPRLAALAAYAKGEKPVIFAADYRGEILDAIELAKDLKIKAIISGGLEAWKVAKELKDAGVPVLIGGTMRLPLHPYDPYDAPYTNPARLYEAGVTFAIRSGARGPNMATAGRNLPYEAAMAVAFGLPEDEAVKAVTLYPARILGVADRLGSLEPGKRANVVITAGHLLQPTTDVKYLFIGGKPVKPESRHTRLYEKFRARLAEVRDGSSPLGIEPVKMAAPSAVQPSAPAASREPKTDPVNRK